MMSGDTASNRSALDGMALPAEREMARAESALEAVEIRLLAPSFAASPLQYLPPDRYRPINPSVAQLRGEMWVVVRGVNYFLDRDGRYLTVGQEPLMTRNFLLRLDDNLKPISSAEVLRPFNLPEPLYRAAQGFEDPRLIAWRGELWCVACLRELTVEGWREQVLARIGPDEEGVRRLTEWRVLRREGPREHEKNWMPRVA